MLYSSFLLGFIGNHPFSTRLFWENNSPIDHRKEAPKTPRIEDNNTFAIHKAEQMLKMPNKRNTHQNLVPVWYSVFMTNGWNTPIITKVQTAIRIPVKCKSILYFFAKVWKIWDILLLKQKYEQHSLVFGKKLSKKQINLFELSLFYPTFAKRV